jgi:hypothetical protein
MEPISTALVVGAIIAGITSGTYLFVLNNYGKRLINSAVDNIQQRFRNIFLKRNILFLGDKGSGKTSLLYYLQNGRPLAQNNRPPEPTFGAVVLDSTVIKTYSKARKEQLAKIVADVSGDKSFRHLWKEIINDTDPHGIIYMLDGRIKDENVEAAVAPIFEDVLSVYDKKSGYKDLANHRLKALHVFVSFSDYWASSKSVIGVKESYVKMAFLKEFEKPEYAHLQNINFAISIINLSPVKTEWPEVDRALTLFGADLNDN